MEDLQDKIIELMDLFDGEVTTADKIDRPQRALDREAIDDFMKRNPMAGGGMLVQPSADGSRPGYSGEYGPNIRESKKSNSFEVTIERGKKVFNKSFNFKTYGSKEKALEAAKEYRDEKRKIPDTRGDKKGGFGAGAPGGSKEQTGGKAKIEKILNNFIKQGKTSFSNADIRAKMNVENFYKSDLNFRRAVDVIKKQPKYKNLTFIKKPRVENPDEAAKLVRKKRQEGLKETDTTKAKGTKKYPFHHIRQITGGVPLTTDDVVIINQRMNSVMSQYDKSLNAIASAIQKNNRLALEAMNAKDEGTALKYMARVDELNETAEKIVNSAIKKLPKKYDGLVGFNQFTLPRDEYGLPISNEPLIVKKVGGMPVSKDAIDLTNLNLKQEAEFKKIVRAQAEAGKVGQIKGLKSFMKANGIKCIVSKSNGGPVTCDMPQAYEKSLNELSTKAQAGDQAAAAKMTNFAKSVRGAGSVIKGVLGPAALVFEAGIAIPLGLFEYSQGKPATEIVDSLTYGLFGKSREDRLKEQMPAYGQVENLQNIDQRIQDLGRLQEGTRGQKLRSKPKFEKAKEEFQTAVEPFLSLENPVAGMLENLKQSEDLRQKLIDEDLQRKEERKTPFDLSNPFMAAKGGRAGFKSGALRKGIQALIDDSVKSTPKDTTTELDKLIKKALDEDFFDKKDRIVDTLNVKAARERKNFPYNQQVFEEPSQLDFYRDIKESNFKTKTGPFFDYQKRKNKAGGGILKEAGDSSGAPPESGPNSQGLQGLLNRGKKG